MDSHTINRAAGLTSVQRGAWLRDVPAGCPCDYIWTGLIWTRSTTDVLCELHYWDAS